MILSLRIAKSEQTMQTQIRLLSESVWSTLLAFRTIYDVVKLNYLIVWMITAILSDVRMFRIFTVCAHLQTLQPQPSDHPHPLVFPVSDR